MYMTQEGVEDFISGIPVGTLVSWAIVLVAFITFVVLEIKKLYKAFEIIKTHQSQSERMREMVERHENELAGISDRLDEIKRMLEAQDETELKRMRHDIIQDGENAIASQKISMRRLRSLEELYKVYHDDRHGNGYVTTLMKKVRELPVVGRLDDEDEEYYTE